jgi:phenylpyruvate tautomerase PptA (4-oxalocrotonate tautomerase family)
MDFVTSLFLSKGKNIIFVVVNRLTKEHYFILCFTREKRTLVKETTRMIIYYIYLLYR